MPRWFTEGLAVHEETEASPEWGDRITPDILVAMRDKKLLPVADSIAASSARNIRTR